MQRVRCVNFRKHTLVCIRRHYLCKQELIIEVTSLDTKHGVITNSEFSVACAQSNRVVARVIPSGERALLLSACDMCEQNLNLVADD